MGKRTQRTFTVSIPKDGYVSVWEDGSWADKRLALYMSEKLNTEVIWLMLSDVTDTWGFIKYSEGRQTDWHAETSSDCLNRAQQFVEQHRLPFALLYFPDPNATDQLAISDGVCEVDETDEDVDLESMEVGLIEEVKWQEVDEVFNVEKLPNSVQDLAADISRFVEVTLPCKGSH